MAITTGTQSEQYQAADGRFLNVIEGREVEAASPSYRGLLDITGLIRVQDEIIGLADVIHENAAHETGKRIIPYYREALILNSKLLKSGLEVDEGVLAVRARSAPHRMLSSYKALLKDYGVGPERDSLVIPVESITAQQVNLLENGEEQLFNPTADIRIRTSSDPTVSRFVNPGEVVQEASQGRWYRFPLRSTVLTVYS